MCYPDNNHPPVNLFVKSIQCAALLWGNAAESTAPRPGLCCPLGSGSGTHSCWTLPLRVRSKGARNRPAMQTGLWCALSGQCITISPNGDGNLHCQTLIRHHELPFFSPKLHEWLDFGLVFQSDVRGPGSIHTCLLHQGLSYLLWHFRWQPPWEYKMLYWLVLLCCKPHSH